MRYRQQDDGGDYVFGQGSNFLVDSPAGVAQAIKTRLLLLTNEWFLDMREGTAYNPKILGHNTHGTRDAEIQSRILGTQGVTSIDAYSSSVDATRSMEVTATVSTLYGPVQLNEIL
jgi:hypothetical protein